MLARLTITLLSVFVALASASAYAQKGTIEAIHPKHRPASHRPATPARRSAAHRPVHRPVKALKHAVAGRPPAPARRGPSGPVSPQLLIVSPGRSAPGSAPSIVEAIRRAGAGARILIQPGTYRESLTLTKAVTLAPDPSAPGDVSIEAVQGPCLVVRSAGVTVKGITFRRQAGQSPQPAVSVPAGSLALEDCTIVGGSAGGVLCSGGGYARLDHCGIHGTPGPCVEFGKNGRGTVVGCDLSGVDGPFPCVYVHDGANPVLRKCMIHDSAFAGVMIASGGRGVLDDCEIYKIGGQGIRVHSGSAPVVRDCTIRDCGREGVWVDTSGMGLFEGCDISGSRQSGCVGIVQLADPTFQQCKIHNGGLEGVSVREKGKGTFEGCELWGHFWQAFRTESEGDLVARACTMRDNLRECVWSENNGRGVYEDCDLSGSTQTACAGSQNGGRPTLRHCRIHNGKGNGVGIQARGLAVLDDCDIVDNAASGVFSTDQGHPWVKRCRINRNTLTAIWVYQGGLATVEDSDLTGNGQGAYHQEPGTEIRQADNRI